jgi:hypothetical protein
MSSVADTVANVQRKIDREKALINAANAMRQSTNNPAVLSRIDGQIKDGLRNIKYFEEKLRDLELQRTTSGVDAMNLQPGGSGSRKANNPLTPPPKDGWDRGYVQDPSAHGQPQSRDVNVGGNNDLKPPRFRHASGAPIKRPNYSKLGM